MDDANLENINLWPANETVIKMLSKLQVFKDENIRVETTLWNSEIGIAEELDLVGDLHRNYLAGCSSIED